MNLKLREDLSFLFFDNIVIDTTGLLQQAYPRGIKYSFKIREPRIVITGEKTASLINNASAKSYGILIFDKSGYLIEYAKKYNKEYGIIKTANDKYYLDKYYFLPIITLEYNNILWKLAYDGNDKYAFSTNNGIVFSFVSDDLFDYLINKELVPVFAKKVENSKTSEYIKLEKISDDTVVQNNPTGEQIIHTSESSKEHKIKLRLNKHPYEESKLVLQYNRLDKNNKIVANKEYLFSNNEETRMLKRISALTGAGVNAAKRILQMLKDKGEIELTRIISHKNTLSAKFASFENNTIYSKLVVLHNDKYAIFVDPLSIPYVKKSKYDIKLANLRLIPDISKAQIKYAYYKSRNKYVIYYDDKIYNLVYKPTRMFNNQVNSKLASFGLYNDTIIFVDENSKKKEVFALTQIPQYNVNEIYKRLVKHYPNLDKDHYKLAEEIYDELLKNKIYHLYTTKNEIKNKEIMVYSKNDKSIYTISIDPITYTLISASYPKRKVANENNSIIYPSILDYFDEAKITIRDDNKEITYTKSLDGKISANTKILKSANEENDEGDNNVKTLTITIIGTTSNKDNPLTDIMQEDKENGMYTINKTVTTIIKKVRDGYEGNDDIVKPEIFVDTGASSGISNYGIITKDDNENFVPYGSLIDIISLTPKTFVLPLAFTNNSVVPLPFVLKSANDNIDVIINNSDVISIKELNKKAPFTIKTIESDTVSLEPVYYDYETGAYKKGSYMETENIITRQQLMDLYGIDNGAILKYNPNFIKQIYFGPLRNNKGIEYGYDYIKIAEDDKEIYIKFNNKISDHILSVEFTRDIENRFEKKASEIQLPEDFVIVNENGKFKALFLYNNYVIGKYDLYDKVADDIEPIFDDMDLRSIAQQLDNIAQIDPEFAQLLNKMIQGLETGSIAIETLEMFEMLKKQIAILIIINEFNDSGISTAALYNLLKTITELLDKFKIKNQSVIEQYLQLQQQEQEEEEEEQEQTKKTKSSSKARPKKK